MSFLNVKIENDSDKIGSDIDTFDTGDVCQDVESKDFFLVVSGNVDNSDPIDYDSIAVVNLRTFKLELVPIVGDRLFCKVKSAQMYIKAN